MATYDPEKVESLVREVQQGSREAFEALYDQFSLDIYRFAVTLVLDKQEAEDITSETFVRVWRSIGTYKKGNFRAYLFMIARNLATDTLRKRQRASVPVEDENEISGGDHTPLLDAVRTEDEKHVYNALVHLSGDYRAVISLRFFNDFSIREVADTLGKTEPSVKIMQHRALAQLRKNLKDDHYER